MIIKANLLNKTNKRIELKDIFRISEINRLEKAIRLSKFSFSEVFSQRTINSIYFDNHSLDSLLDSIDGNCLRKKTRIRWYGNSSNNNPGTLEIKRKKGLISWKESAKDSYVINSCANVWQNFITKKNPQDIFFYESENLSPKSIVTYNRRYFASFDRKIRITIDNDLKFFEQQCSKNPNFKYGNYRNQIIIVEIKVDLNNSSIVNELLSDLPFTSQRYSKYSESITYD